jgi:hypothetical protein
MLPSRTELPDPLTRIAAKTDRPATRAAASAAETETVASPPGVCTNAAATAAAGVAAAPSPACALPSGFVMAVRATHASSPVVEDEIKV